MPTWGWILTRTNQYTYTYPLKKNKSENKL